MKSTHTFHRTLLAVVTSVIANACAYGQEIQLSPSDLYDSILTASTSTSSSKPVASTAPGQADAGSTSVRGTAPVTQPGRPVERGPVLMSSGSVVPDPTVVSEPPKNDRNGDLRSADLTKFLPPVGQQTKDGDCVAWALAYASYSCQICQARNRTDPPERIGKSSVLHSFRVS